MFENIFDTTFGIIYFVIFILSTLFIIPAFCMLASSIKRKKRFEIYATGEVVAASINLFGFLSGYALTIATIALRNIESLLLFALVIFFECITFLSFLVYIGVLGKRKRFYGVDTSDENSPLLQSMNSGWFIFDLVELIFEIFSCFF